MNKQEMKLEKVRKSCSTAQKVITVLRNIMLASIVVCLVGAVLCQCFAKTINAEMPVAIAGGRVSLEETNIDIFDGMINFDVEMQELINEGHYALVFTAYCIAGAVALAAAVVIFNQFIKIFKAILASETPFSEEVLGKLKSAFIVTVVLVALITGLGEAVFMGLTFWCIYTLIDYGAVLQMEVDETL